MTEHEMAPPLTPLTFQILLALAQERRHGYGIIKAVRDATEGAVSPGTGTFYSAIHRMVSAGQIAEIDAPAGADSTDERRRYYEITDEGHRALANDARRLEAWARAARATRPDRSMAR